MSIEGKVALIIDEHNLVVNKGHSDGVRNGMAFVVVAQVDNVTDPDTNEDLGQWEGIKARLVAVHVQERLSVLAPAGEPRRFMGQDLHQTLSAEMVRVSMASSSQTELDIDRTNMQGMPHLGPVKVGDSARQVE